MGGHFVSKCKPKMMNLKVLVCHQFQIYGREFGCPLLAMLYHLIYLKKYENHFVTLHVQNSKFKLHCTCKFCCKYQLQYTYCFLLAKTEVLPHHLCYQVLPIYISLLIYIVIIEITTNTTVS